MQTQPQFGSALDYSDSDDDSVVSTQKQQLITSDIDEAEYADFTEEDDELYRQQEQLGLV
jgi:hypothetical protein